VRENGIAKLRIRQVCEHRRLDRGHDLARRIAPISNILPLVAAA
jgi:hypothetical protein